MLYHKYGTELVLIVLNIPVIIPQLILLLIFIPLVYSLWIVFRKCDTVFRPGKNFPRLGLVGLALWYVATAIDEYIDFVIVLLLVILSSAIVAFSIFDDKRMLKEEHPLEKSET